MKGIDMHGRDHYGSIELKGIVGPNLLKGLLVSVTIHCLAVFVPYLVWFILHEDKPAEKPMRVVTLAQIPKIVPRPETPKSVPIPSGRSGKRGGGIPGSIRPPAQMNLQVQPLDFEEVDGSFPVEPKPSVMEPLLKNAIPDYLQRQAIPVADSFNVAYPTNAPSDPMAGLSSTQSHHGGVLGAQGSVDLPDIALSPYGGPQDGPEGLGGSNGLGTGLGGGTGRGSGGYGPGSGGGIGGGEGPGTGLTGTGPGSGDHGSGRGNEGDFIAPSRLEPPEPVLTKSALNPITKTELSGLISWMRQQKGRFPQVVQSYMETRGSELCGITSFEGWNIFVQFSEEEHQLKIFLARGDQGILLADSDFRQRSQLFAIGRVTRGVAEEITAIVATRDKPSASRTDEFYRVFGDWMSTNGISMGSRAAK
jgi:hypothetical protein